MEKQEIIPQYVQKLYLEVRRLTLKIARDKEQYEQKAEQDKLRYTQKSEQDKARFTELSSVLVAEENALIAEKARRGEISEIRILMEEIEKSKTAEPEVKAKKLKDIDKEITENEEAQIETD
jgi:hypothetical protein